MPNQEPGSKEKNNKAEVIKPEPETLHTPDPQKKMEGPVSSTMHGTGKAFDTTETKKEADKEKDEKM